VRRERGSTKINEQEDNRRKIEEVTTVRREIGSQQRSKREEKEVGRSEE
jgi:hypothetical protein